MPDKSAKSPVDPRSAAWRQDGFVIAISLFLAIVLWFLAVLERDYESLYTIPVYIELEEPGLMWEKTPPDRVRMLLRGQGVDLMFYHLNFLRDTLRMPSRGAIDRGYIHTRNYLGVARDLLPNSLSVERIFPDTLPVQVVRRSRKRVPIVSQVVFRGDVFHKKGERMEPDSVTLVGSPTQLDSVSEWRTVPLTIPIDKQKMERVVPLDTAQGIELYPTTVKFRVEATRYTEKLVTLHLIPVEVPPEQEVVFYPSFVQLSCLVPLENYNKLVDTIRQRVPFSELDARKGEFVPELSYWFAERPDVYLVLRTPFRVSYVIRNPIPSP